MSKLFNPSRGEASFPLRFPQQPREFTDRLLRQAYRAIELAKKVLAKSEKVLAGATSQPRS